MNQCSVDSEARGSIKMLNVLPNYVSTIRSSNPKNLDFKVKNEKATSYQQNNNYKNPNNMNNKNIPN